MTPKLPADTDPRFIVASKRTNRFMRGGVPPRWGRVDQARKFSGLSSVQAYFRRLLDWKIALDLSDLMIIEESNPDRYIPADSIKIPERGPHGE